MRLRPRDPQPVLCMPLDPAGGLLCSDPVASLQERLPPLGPNSDTMEPRLLALQYFMCNIIKQCMAALAMGPRARSSLPQILQWRHVSAVTVSSRSNHPVKESNIKYCCRDLETFLTLCLFCNCCGTLSAVLELV